MVLPLKQYGRYGYFEKFKEFLFKNYDALKGTETSKEKLTDYLIKHQLIKEQTARNYAIVAEYAQMRKDESLQIKVILQILSEKYGLHTRTIRDIVDEYSKDFGF